MNTRTQGRRGYYLYEYGPHLWFPEVQADWSGGMFRDVARQSIPGNGVYDSLNFMFDRPGVAYKRGGTAFFGGTATGFLSPAYFNGIAQFQIPSGNAKMIATADTAEAFAIDTSTQALGPMVTPSDKPCLFISGSVNLLVVPGTTTLINGTHITGIPWVWDGATPPTPLGFTGVFTLDTTGASSGTFVLRVLHYTGGTTTTATTTVNFNSSAATLQTALNGLGMGTWACAGGPLPGALITITRPNSTYTIFVDSSSEGGSFPLFTWGTAATNCPNATLCTSHLSRIVLASSSSQSQRIYFSPALDIRTAWDATAYVDADNAVTGLASIGGSTLLAFTAEGVEKFTGDTPPPGSNFTHATVNNVGCTDSRSIVPYGGGVIYANQTGVYLTNGVGDPTSLLEGRIGSYWRAQMAAASYSPQSNSGISGSTISAGILSHRFLVVSVLDSSGAPNKAFLFGIIRDMQTGSCGRLSGPRATMYASGSSANPELYAVTAGTTRVYALSGFTAPTSSNKNDADGTAVTCTLETRPFGGGPNMAAFGKAHLTYDMRDAASDNPTLAVSVAPGLEATTYAAVAESPLAKTTDATRTRYATGKRSQALSVKIVQTNASSKTEVYMVEQDTRGFPRDTGGQ